MSCIEMRYLGWSNILIREPQGDLVFDPFFRKMYGAEWARKEDYGKVRVICVSHGHHEHYMDTPAVARVTGALVVSSPDVCEHLRRKHRLPESQLRPVLPFDTVEVHGYRITAFDWHHRPISYLRFFQGSLAAAFAFVGNNILRCPWRARYYGFAVQTQSGASMVNLTEGMNPLFSDGELDVLRQRFRPDVLIGGHQLVYEQDVARAVRLTGVSSCVLYHPHEKLFGQMGIASAPQEQVVAAVKAQAPDVDIRLPRPMEWITVQTEGPCQDTAAASPEANA